MNLAQFIVLTREQAAGKSTNNLCSIVRQYKINGNIIIVRNRCDYLVLNDDLKTAYLIELKGSKIPHAIKQLDDTFNIMKDNLPDYTFFQNCLYGKMHAYRPR